METMVRITTEMVSDAIDKNGFPFIYGGWGIANVNNSPAPKCGCALTHVLYQKHPANDIDIDTMGSLEMANKLNLSQSYVIGFMNAFDGIDCLQESTLDDYTFEPNYADYLLGREDGKKVRTDLADRVKSMADYYPTNIEEAENDES